MVSVMNRQEFMERLEHLLQNIPEQERVEAVQYYNDYFDDAGEENEQAVLDALGTPAQVAENIKRDMSQNRYTYDCEQQKVSQGKEVVKYQPELEKIEEPRKENKKGKMSTGMIVLIVVLCIFASPVLVGLLGVLIGVLGTLGSLLVTWLILIATFAGVAIVLMAVAIVLVVIGIMGLVVKPLAGLGIVGGGMLVAAIGLLLLMLAVWMAGKATPAMWKGIGWLFRKLTGKNKAV